MKSTRLFGVSALLSVICLAATADAQYGTYAAPSMLPLPQSNYDYPTTRYPIVHTSSRFSDSSPTEAAPRSNGHPLPAQPAPIEPLHHDYGNLQHGHGNVQHGYGNVQHGYGKESHSLGSKCDGCGGNSYQCDCDIRSHLNALKGKVFSPAYGMYGARTGCGWYGSVGGLVMNRDNDNHYFFSYGDGLEALQLGDIRDADMDWSGGVEARVGHYFNCGQNAVEMVYWGLYPGQQESILTAGQVNGALNAILNFDQLDAFDSRTGTDVDLGGWVNNADAHRIRRDFTFHNVELNLLNYSGCTGFGACGNPRFQYNWGCGVRYFRFTENLWWSANETGAGVVFDGGADQVDYHIDVENNLIGFQLGGNGEYFLKPCLSFVFGTKVGIYANYMDQHSVIQTNGGVAWVNNGPNQDEDFDIASNKTDMSLLGEVNVGLKWRMSRCWSATLGYRVVGITGLATAAQQIPGDLRGTHDVRLIDSGGSMLLHGGFAGIEFNY